MEVQEAEVAVLVPVRLWLGDRVHVRVGSRVREDVHEADRDDCRLREAVCVRVSDGDGPEDDRDSCRLPEAVCVPDCVGDEVGEALWEEWLLEGLTWDADSERAADTEQERVGAVQVPERLPDPENVRVGASVGLSVRVADAESVPRTDTVAVSVAVQDSVAEVRVAPVPVPERARVKLVPLIVRDSVRHALTVSVDTDAETVADTEGEAVAAVQEREQVPDSECVDVGRCVGVGEVDAVQVRVRLLVRASVGAEAERLAVSSPVKVACDALLVRELGLRE